MICEKCNQEITIKNGTHIKTVNDIVWVRHPSRNYEIPTITGQNFYCTCGHVTHKDVIEHQDIDIYRVTKGYYYKDDK